MTTFQLLLLIIAGGVFYLFFKQLFSGNHPKRGVDFEAKVGDDQIGGINRPDKTFSKPTVQPTRMQQLLTMADEAVEKNDMEEAKKALQSARIVDENNIDVLQRSGYVALQAGEYDEAKSYYGKIITLDERDDMAHVLLANVFHKLGDEEEAQKHHEEAIRIDREYAPHHFNYANTLYDIGRKEEALVHYKKAYELDNTLDEAQKMITTLGSK
ncbi:MAG: tetratricopeptide repeat protein [Campylobacterota bacterium]|nr:tetratricopeptide repeat protein [Campylobacterota bacterium]